MPTSKDRPLLANGNIDWENMTWVTRNPGWYPIADLTDEERVVFNRMLELIIIRPKQIEQSRKSIKLEGLPPKDGSTEPDPQ